MGFSSGTNGTSSIAGSTDIILNNTANGQVISYDTSQGKWKNQTIATTVAGKTGAVSLVENDIANLTTDLAAKAQAFGGGLETVQTIAASGSAQTLNLANGNLIKLTLTASCTVSLTGATAGKACSLTLMLTQDTTGGRTVSWPGSVRWSGSTAPTLTTTANKTDFVALLTIDGGSSWYGFLSGLNY